MGDKGQSKLRILTPEEYATVKEPVKCMALCSQYGVKAVIAQDQILISYGKDVIPDEVTDTREALFILLNGTYKGIDWNAKARESCSFTPEGFPEIACNEDCDENGFGIEGYLFSKNPESVLYGLTMLVFRDDNYHPSFPSTYEEVKDQEVVKVTPDAKWSEIMKIVRENCCTFSKIIEQRLRNLCICRITAKEQTPWRLLRRA